MDRFEISTLRSYYGALLTDRQNEMLVMHYDEDLSFGEIAQITGVSRQAVLDGINKGERHLVEYENALHLVEKDNRIHAIVDALIEQSSEDAVEHLYELKKILEE